MIQGKTIIEPGSDNKYCQINNYSQLAGGGYTSLLSFLTPESTFTSQILHYLTNPFRKTSPFQRRRTDKRDYTSTCKWGAFMILGMFLYYLVFFLLLRIFSCFRKQVGRERFPSPVKPRLHLATQPFVNGGYKRSRADLCSQSWKMSNFWKINCNLLKSFISIEPWSVIKYFK